MRLLLLMLGISDCVVGIGSTRRSPKLSMVRDLQRSGGRHKLRLHNI